MIPTFEELASFVSQVVRIDGKPPLDPLQVPHALVPLFQIPRARTTYAAQLGVSKNLLLKTWGGLGDQICAGPTLEFAVEKFTADGCEVSLASEHPEMFKHISFKKVYDLKTETPNYINYFPFETIVPPTSLVWQFFGHMLVHCVDFPSMCAFRMQLPNHRKEIHLTGKNPGWLGYDFKRAVFIHPGRHWQSKTFPATFWDAVINRVLERGSTPVLIGANTDDNRGTVDVKTCAERILDLRNKLTIPESIWMLQHARVLLTNDSAPLHMAASGDAAIGFVATCKHPDFITHWRHGEFGWNMQNFSRGGVWDVTPYCPNRTTEYSVENVDPELLASWLPDPAEFADWACDRAN